MQEWLSRLGRRPNPGRLCDLLHIIDRAADNTRAVSMAHMLNRMLKPEILKENVDVEAVERAWQRLSAIPVRRRILMVMTDGAPTDDLTALENGADFLARHLAGVIDRLKAEGDVTLLPIRIGREAVCLYPEPVSVDIMLDLPATMNTALAGAMDI